MLLGLFAKQKVFLLSENGGEAFSHGPLRFHRVPLLSEESQKSI